MYLYGTEGLSPVKKSLKTHNKLGFKKRVLDLPTTDVELLLVPVLEVFKKCHFFNFQRKKCFEREKAFLLTSGNERKGFLKEKTLLKDNTF